MKAMYRGLIVVLAVATVALALAPMAAAECGSLNAGPNPGALLKPQAWNGSDDLSASLMLVSDNDPVVGFWKVKLTAKDTPGIPDGTVLDDGFQQWHSDGTEIMNSSRVPATGNFCMGVWKKTAPSKYRLNHFGLSWDLSNTYVGPANIRSNIVLSNDGNKFTGTFTIDQYDTNGNVLAHLQGQIVGKRETVYTGVASVL
jgi:hypothetical protein